MGSLVDSGILSKWRRFFCCVWGAGVGLGWGRGAQRIDEKDEPEGGGVFVLFPSPVLYKHRGDGERQRQRD